MGRELNRSLAKIVRDHRAVGCRFHARRTCHGSRRATLCVDEQFEERQLVAGASLVRIAGQEEQGLVGNENQTSTFITRLFVSVAKLDLSAIQLDGQTQRLAADEDC